MPDLMFRRGDTLQPKMVCMYCGKRATHARERRIRNPRLDPPAGGGAGHGFNELPRGDDPISGCIAIVLLPFVLIGLARGVRDGWRHAMARRAAPPLDPPHTLVRITTCDRHRNYGRRFLYAAFIGFAVLVVGWVAMILHDRDRLAAPLWLAGGVAVGTVAFPIVFLFLWGSDGPVRVSRVGRDTVMLSHVRKAYFDAPS